MFETEKKIRVWSIKNKKMFQVDTFWFFENHVYIKKDRVWHNKNSSKDIEVEDENVFMKFIGIKDKNDKEVYQGDIVQSPFRPGKRWVIISDRVIPTVKLGNTEVIGNVFENPELIK